ncbi:BZIP-type transcription factor mbz1 [Claviceps maximensis]|nr:BZIP-type transcription factor mbz1 [Claviceps maximensis]
MSASGENHVDFDALLNFSPEDFSNTFNSPSLSPTPSLKPTFVTPVTAAITTPTIPTTQILSGPSHNYGMYPQQTGFVPGAIAHTMAVNQTNDTGYQAFGSVEYLSGLNRETDAFSFNSSPSQGVMDIDLQPQPESQACFSTVNPSSIEQDTSSVASRSSSVGRLWPGAHSQAALAKAEAQQRQQQENRQQQQQQQQLSQPQYMNQQPQRQNTQKTRGKGSQPTDPIVEQKITQLLNSMRAKSAGTDSEAQSVSNNIHRAKKDDEDMDEDERLLASEEGKKLSSKERRQLRNKVSARAFRSRRKEYITQLEAEIASKVNENGDLRSQNRALMDDNKRLTDLTHMLLASPSFSDFLDNLSSKSAAVLPQNASVKVEQTQQQEHNEVSKELNSYNEQFTSQEQIGIAMVPELPMDFSMGGSNNMSYNFQPQVFVVDTPEVANAIDANLLSGKTSKLLEEVFTSDEEKVQMSAIERPLETSTPESVCDASVDEEFEADPQFALFHSETTLITAAPNEIHTEDLIDIDIFGDVEAEKVLTRFELVDATEQEASAASAMARVLRISAYAESVVSRLELLTMGLS